MENVTGFKQLMKCLGTIFY